MAHSLHSIAEFGMPLLLPISKYLPFHCIEFVPTSRQPNSTFTWSVAYVGTYCNQRHEVDKLIIEECE